MIKGFSWLLFCLPGPILPNSSTLKARQKSFNPLIRWIRVQTVESGFGQPCSAASVLTDLIKWVISALRTSEGLTQILKILESW